MPVIDRVAELRETMAEWRHRLHSYPETAFEEYQTAAFVAERLRAFGLEVNEGIAGTGVVGSLRCGDGPAIGLRADMDALPITEATNLPYCSTRLGKMHACGHDGHTAMLLGAAQYLSETRTFNGTVHFIFQPAEESAGGGRVMVEQGLFDKFPVERVFGMHNWPGLPAGTFAARTGPMMAACDSFDIAIIGKGCHAAMPHLGSDAILVASAVVGALQTIVSRSKDPVDTAVVSVTQFNAGEALNIISERAALRGTVRSFSEHVQDQVESRMRQLVEGLAVAHGCQGELTYRRKYPATVNSAAETEMAAAAAARVVGRDHVVIDPPPTMGSEDFSFMLRVKPGSYIWLGSGRTGDDPSLHNPQYDFNDDVLSLGASYWATLVEQSLP